MKIAIVGCGLIGKKRADAAPVGTVCCVADVDQARALSLAQAHNAVAYTDWQNVAKSEAELVIIATTHLDLAKIGLAMIEAGKHVLIEKPGGQNADQLEAIQAAADARGLVAKVGFNHRFHPAMQKAKEIFESGEAGPRMFIRGRYGHGGRLGYEKEWRMTRSLSGGGQLIDQGAHLLDLSRWFMGEVRNATGWLRTAFWNADVEDNCFVALEDEDGSMAWLHAGWTEWKNIFSFEIMCRNAKLDVSGLGGSYGIEQLTHYKMLPEMGPPETTIWQWPFADRSWELEISNTIDAINGRAAPIGTAADAAAMLRLVEKVYEKA